MEISWFPVLEETRVEEYPAEIFAKCEERFGFVPNVFRAYAWRPDRFQRWLGYFNHCMKPTDTLGAAEREMIAVAVSMENKCLYCLAAHGYEVRRHLEDPELGEIVTLDWRRADLGERHEAMLAYAVKVATAPRECTRDDIDQLRKTGFTEEDVWDIAEVAALYSSTNRMAMATGMVPNACYHSMER